jgi:hypothetical protein
VAIEYASVRIVRKPARNLVHRQLDRSQPAGGCLIGEAVRRTTEQNAGIDDLIAPETSW